MGQGPMALAVQGSALRPRRSAQPASERSAAKAAAMRAEQRIARKPSQLHLTRTRTLPHEGIPRKRAVSHKAAMSERNTALPANPANPN